MQTSNVEILEFLISAAMASYGDLTEENFRRRLIDAKFTETQADEFIERYDFVHQQPNTASGFSATVFWDKIDQKYVMAFRGSELEGLGPITDWVTTNFEGIGRRGYAVDQAIDLYRYWKQLMTPARQEVVHSDEKAWQQATQKVA